MDPEGFFIACDRSESGLGTTCESFAIQTGISRIGVLTANHRVSQRSRWGREESIQNADRIGDIQTLIVISITRIRTDVIRRSCGPRK